MLDFGRNVAEHVKVFVALQERFFFFRLLVTGGGGGGIRTHEGRGPLAVFKTAALNRSATPPSRKRL